MRRETLRQLMVARREGRVLVRALNLDSNEERLIDLASDSSQLGEAAAMAFARDGSARVTIGAETWFLSPYHAPWEIVMIGAVHIAQALAGLGLAAGYRVRVIDPRAAYTGEDRFPGVAIEREWPDQALSKRSLTRRSALIALAHDPKLDDAGLIAGLRSPAFYVGALGSVRTHARRLERLAAEGFTPQELDKIRGPVGLAIGARSPVEIAIAVLAELVERRRRPPPRIAGIVLAAGLSSRMGRNKLTMAVGGKTLIQRPVEAALGAGLDPVIVVTGHEAGAVREALATYPVRPVQNESFAEGLSSSLRAGIRAVPADCEGAMVLLGDMPDISAGLTGRLVAAFEPSRPGAICVATFKGQRGHPVLWGRRFFSRIEELRGDAGARELMEQHPENLREIEAGSDAPLVDIDTVEAATAYAAR